MQEKSDQCKLYVSTPARVSTLKNLQASPLKFLKVMANKCILWQKMQGSPQSSILDMHDLCVCTLPSGRDIGSLT